MTVSFLTSYKTQTLQVLLTTLFLIAGLSLRASASLGGDLASVHRDNTHVLGGLQVTAGDRYTTCEITISTGTHLREFVSPSGVVFGIAWDGPIVPELQQFLGAYFQSYLDAVRAQKSKAFSRRPLRIHLPDLVFETGGHMGSYYGRAYIQQTVPPDVAIAEIR
jgi:hypothetical protein